ncbi:hypothetical protein Ancab_031345 [Ancistrocladus abbreviatus]
MLDMDVQVGTGTLKGRQAMSADSLKLNDGANGTVMFNSKDCECIDPSDVVGCLDPVTPNPNRESGEGLFDSKTPLFMLSPLLPNSDCFESLSSVKVMAAPDDSPHTPKEEVFDPFAPGPDEMVFAPISKKLMKQSPNIVARRLNFNDFSDGFWGERNDNNVNDVETLSEEMFLESVYQTLLEAIVLKQIEIFLAEDHPSHSTGSETPSSPPRLTGIAETCPPAPIKPVAYKLWNVDPKICRKLEF